ncbi:MAG: hypothetical protein J7L88_02145, partial [Thermoplasmata archaeon]|nr:hypothetical protein [Thermoplasmata archaeon]
MSEEKCTERLISASEVEKWAYCPLSWLLSKEHRVESEALKRGEEVHSRIDRDLKRSIVFSERSKVEVLSFWIGIGVFVLLFAIGIGVFIFLNLRWWKNLTLLFTFLSALFLALSLYSFQRNFNVEYKEDGGGSIKKVALPMALIFGAEGILLYNSGTLSSLLYMAAFILIWYLLLFTLLLYYSLKRKSVPSYILYSMAISSLTFLFVVLFAFLSHIIGINPLGILISGTLSYALLLLSLRKIKGVSFRSEMRESISLSSKEGITVIFFSTAVILLAITGSLSSREGLTIYGNFSLYLSLAWLVMAGIMAIISVYHRSVSEELREWVGGREVKESMASGKGRLLIS